MVRVKAAYLAIGITMDGEKEVRGSLAGTNGRHQILAAGRHRVAQRSVQDIFVACVDGLKGFQDAIEAVSLETTVQLCIVHMVQYNLNYVSWNDARK